MLAGELTIHYIQGQATVILWFVVFSIGFTVDLACQVICLSPVSAPGPGAHHDILV
jgi:hypothetical protein